MIQCFYPIQDMCLFLNKQSICLIYLYFMSIITAINYNIVI